MSQQSRKAQIQAAFPILRAEDILECLAALEIPATLEDITKPTAASSYGIYAYLLEVLMGATGDAIEGPKQALLGMIEYKDLYNDTLQFVMFFKHCRRLALLCGINDFAMADLTRPEPVRFRKALSGIMNFAKFRDERMQTHAIYQEAYVKQQRKALEMRQKSIDLERQLQEIAKRNEADRPQSEKAQQRNEGLRSELMELNTARVKITHEYDELKKEKQQFLELVASNTKVMTQMDLQKAAAESRLVQSPDRLRRHISEMTYSIQSEKARLASFQQKARELSNRLDVISSLEVDLKSLIDLEHGIQEQRGKAEETKRGKATLEGRLEGKRIESQSLSAKLEQLQKQLLNASHKLGRQEEMRKEMREKGAKRIEELKAEYMKRTKERHEWQSKRDTLLAQQKKLESEMNAYITKHENEINELLQEYWSMRRQAEDYMNMMTVKLGLRLEA
ncbi:hypothetical protein B9479_007683 [Cryptococcus floricola]|uniref:Uncharacterized protein n=1 Tax=Cryptococcus floricola TaxID=2591691 RepID=A0A5D3ANM7_9TREE|nr:hypothetical protein B9479_007683 [Cryptococcus floricola]